MMSYSVLLCVVVALVAVSATDYCEPCEEDAKHVACGHNGKFNASCPADAEMETIIEQMKRVIVETHNEKRNFIAGGGNRKFSRACRMATMGWDDELASLAALRVKSCYYGYDSCLFTDDFFNVGQNIGYTRFNYSRSLFDNLKNFVEEWYTEVEYSNQSYFDRFPKSYTTFFYQFALMMTARNNRVGCAASTFSEKGTSYKILYLACNYATDNLVGIPVYDKCYIAGTSCTTGMHPRYENLCSFSERYENKWY